jgi:elongation factor 1-gamma
MPPTYKLYAPPGSFRAFAPLVAAEYNGIDVEVETNDVEKAVQAKSPTGKAPILETPKGVIFSSHAMARYVAGLRRDTGLLGNSLQEQSSVDSWMDWTAQDVELPACVLFYPVAGYMPVNADA